MTARGGSKRIDTASRVIQASPEMLYRALLDPRALVAWLPPEGMTGEFQQFEAREGGRYRMTLTYDDADDAPGKSSQHSDVVNGRFVELVRDVRVVQQVEFETDDEEFDGAMTMTWALAKVAAGTEVKITCENVPDGISKDDHAEGLASSLKNLAAYIED